MNEDKKIYENIDLNSILDELKLHRGLSSIPNLEIELYELNVASAGALNSIDNKQTKAEHDKILGVFSFYKGNGSETVGSKFRMIVGNKPLISTDFLDFSVIEKTNYISVEQAAFRLDFPINSSDVKIEYKDGGTEAIPYKVYFAFIVHKKAL